VLNAITYLRTNANALSYTVLIGHLPDGFKKSSRFNYRWSKRVFIHWSSSFHV